MFRIRIRIFNVVYLLTIPHVNLYSGLLRVLSGSVVVNSVLFVAPIVAFCICSLFCCSLICVISSFTIILMGKAVGFTFVFLLSCDCYCSVAFPHSAECWCKVCNCGIN